MRGHSPAQEPLRTPAEVVHAIQKGSKPFAVLRSEHHPDEVLVLEGEIVKVTALCDIPRTRDGVLCAIPFSQIRERGFVVPESDLPILCLLVQRITRVSNHELLALLPQETIHLRDGIHFHYKDQEYAAIVRKIQEDEIGRGSGCNFVIPQTAEADIEAFDRSKALSMFRSLLENEYGAYMTFIFCDGEHYLIGASPERHLQIEKDSVTMTPISGTYRKQDGKIDREAFEKFLQDSKEIKELFMVLDEELKMMAAMCERGGAVQGPFLREMSKVVHTEYQLIGKSDKDVIELLRASMWAPTVTGGPMRKACEVIQSYDSEDRRYYGGAIVFLGRDGEGRDRLDSAITIRTMEIDVSGHVTAKAGATIVHSSIPLEEALEAKAKLSALLVSLESKPASPSTPQLPGMMNAALKKMLEVRNADLSSVLIDDQENIDRTVDVLKGTRVSIIENGDGFSHTLGHLLSMMGMEVRIINAQTFDASSDDAAIVLIGPGPGDPMNQEDPAMRRLGEITVALLAENRPVLGICLGHQFLASALGIPLYRQSPSTQGETSTVTLPDVGERIVGRYHTFTALAQNIPSGLEVFLYPPDKEDVQKIAYMRRPSLVGMQFHPESILTKNGLEILRDALLYLRRHSV